MPSTEEKIKKIINQNQELFMLLEDLDKTGKLRKLKYKSRATFTLDEELFRKFRGYCSSNHLEMSPIVEELVRDYIRKQQMQK
ncbi:MAG: hypothetical protein AABY26_06210 [Nanoarchaeota archaeon]